MKPKSTHRPLLAIAASSLMAVSSASAQSLFWSANGTSQGGAGTWDTSTARWGSVAAGPYTTTWNNATNANDTAVFGSTAGAVALGTPVTVGGLTFNTTGYSITGSTLTLAGASAPVISAGNSITATISSNIAGTVGFEKTGAGTLILSGTNNTYSGTTTLTAGTLRGSDSTNSLTPVSPFGSSSLTLNAGTTLDLRAEGTPNNSVETITYGNNTTVAGDTTIHVQRFGGTSNNKIIALGTLSIGANTLNVTAATSYSLQFGATTLTGNAVFNATSGGLFLGSITESGGSYSLTKNGSSSLQINGNTSYTGATTISAGNLQLGNGGTTGSLSNTSSFSINNTLIVNRSNAFTQATDLNGHALTGSASFTQAGTGTTTLSLTNTYTGATAVTAGTLSINTIDDYGNDSAIGRGTAGTPIILGGGNNGGATGTLEYTGGVQSTDRTIQVGSVNQNTTGGARILNNGTGALTFTAATFTPTYTQTNTNTRNLTLGGTNGGTINGTIQNISGSMQVSLTKVGSGTWTLGGINTYTNNTDVNAGTLGLQSGNTNITQTLAALRFQVADGTLNSNKSGTGSISTTFSSVARSAGATGNFVSSGGTNGTDNSLNITGTAGFLNAGLYFGGSEFAARNGTNGYVRALNYATAGGDTNTVDVNTVTASRHVKLATTPYSGAGMTLLSLNLAGSGINWTNTTGNLTVPGILKSGGGSQSTISGGTVATASNAELVIRTDTANDSLLISSVVNSGSGALTKTGAGTLTLSNTNTYTGQTHVNAGILSISANANLGSQTTGATLNLKGGTLQATGTFGLFNDTAGTNNRAVTLLDQSTIEVTGSNTLTIAGVISNNANAVNAPGFNKTGSGTLVLSDANTYTGATTISGGKLTIGSGGNINTSSGVSVGAGEFNYNSSTAFNQSVSFSGTGGTISGTGTIGTAVTVTSGNFISPGNSPGIQPYAAGLTWNNGGTYTWEVNNWAGTTAGTDFDQIQVSGGNLNIGSLTSGSFPTNTFKIGITGLTAGNVVGAVPSFANTATKSWTILTAGALTGTFNPNLFTLDTTSFTGSNNLSGGSFSLTNPSGGNLQLTFTPGNSSQILISSSPDSTTPATGASAKTIALGRVLAGGTTVTASQSIGKTAGATDTNVAPYTVTIGGDVTATGLSSGSFASGAQSASGTITLDTATAGSKSGTVTIANTTSTSYGAGLGSNDANDVFTVTATAVNQRSFSVGTPTIALGTIHSGTASSGGTAISSSGLNAVTANASLGSFSGTNTNGLTLTTVDPTAFNGGSATQTADYVIGGTVTAGILSGASFSSTVTAEFGSISDVVVNVTGSVFDGNATWTGVGSAWGSGASANWVDANTVNAAPGTFDGFGGIDTANFTNAGIANTTVSLNGSSPSLNAITFNSTSSYTIAQGSGGSITMAGTTPTITTTSGDHTISAVVTGSAGLTKAGAGKLTLSGTNTYTGATTVNAGILAVNGSLASTSTTIQTGGTLQGSGTIGGSVTIQNGGTLAAGNSIESLGTGTLNFDANSTFAYEFDTDLYDGGSASVAGDLTYSSGSLNITAGAILTLNDLAMTSTALAAGSKLTLISYMGSWNLGVFSYDDGSGLAAVTNNSIWTIGANQWQFKYDDISGGPNFASDQAGSHFTMTVIPEPKAALLGSIGMLLLLRRRR